MQGVQSAQQVSGQHVELSASNFSGQGVRSDGVGDCDADAVVSFHAELPESLQLAMTSFIERYPNWDQYRLIQAALAGFLVQNGVESREITRLYVGNMFRRQSLLQGV